MQDLAHPGRTVFFGERRPPADELIQRHAQAVNVGPLVAAAAEPLRCRVTQRPQKVAAVRERERVAGIVRSPKSVTHTVCRSSSKRFDGLISRWITPWAWA